MEKELRRSFKNPKPNYTHMHGYTKDLMIQLAQECNCHDTMNSLISALSVRASQEDIIVIIGELKLEILLDS